MINRVGESRVGALNVPRVGAGSPAAAPKAGDAPAGTKSGSAGAVVADIVAKGPPVDDAKVAAIKAAIAQGRYPVDPVRIAEGMIALGFGPKA